MGVQVVAKGVDAEQYATEYAAPVRRGLEGVFFLNTSLEKCARNYAPGKAAGAIVGSPQVAAGFISCKGMTNYVQTQIQETSEVTMLVIARSADVPGTPDTTPLICGCFATGVTSGVSLYGAAADRVSGTGGFGDDDPGNSNVVASVNPVALSSWGLYSVVIAANGVTTKSHTANLSILNAQTKPRRPSTRTLRIGSGYSNSQKGNVDIALFQCHSVALTADELARTVADLRAYAARRGIVV
ncbi:hypothetical protein [Pseudomonas moorei]|uniref:Uncharacterized protein n=1 Tax=Pseudomonas moorei TaxID=395599 RepID=A0A1H1CSU8_9PSED|nr:hypothetical protein [Pseudomonas moorei]KAB0504690.1 hypothetical protein F7R06_13255 [Pseudomonas moorei]SDQ66958.1 hypothetical protein SAMN04490195_1356 [Pseudomonas moorei]